MLAVAHLDLWKRVGGGHKVFKEEAGVLSMLGCPLYPVYTPFGLTQLSKVGPGKDFQ